MMNAVSNIFITTGSRLIRFIQQLYSHCKQRQKNTAIEHTNRWMWQANYAPAVETYIKQPCNLVSGAPKLTMRHCNHASAIS
ncbi:MAG: hypothetical protein LBV41_07880 [Cytophagaceae bacterium]|jgi:hypothetical protein|nr:hypothetical protein [Cytophagaceae bacterium]